MLDKAKNMSKVQSDGLRFDPKSVFFSPDLTKLKGNAPSLIGRRGEPKTADVRIRIARVSTTRPIEMGVRRRTIDSLPKMEATL